MKLRRSMLVAFILMLVTTIIVTTIYYYIEGSKLAIVAGVIEIFIFITALIYSKD